MCKPRERVTGEIKFTSEKLPYITIKIYSSETNLASHISGILDTGTFPSVLHSKVISAFFGSSLNRELLFSFNGEAGYMVEVRKLPQNSGVNKFLMEKNILGIFSPQQLLPSTSAYMIMDFANGQFSEAYGTPEEVKQQMDTAFGKHAKSIKQSFSSTIVKTLDLANKDYRGLHIVVNAKFDGIEKPALIDTGCVETVFSHKRIQPDKQNIRYLNIANSRLKIFGNKSCTIQLGKLKFKNSQVAIGGKGFQNANFSDLKSSKKVSSIIGAPFFKDNRMILAVPFWAEKRPIIIGKYNK